jgi:hypothetical protein
MPGALTLFIASKYLLAVEPARLTYVPPQALCILPSHDLLEFYVDSATILSVA